MSEVRVIGRWPFAITAAGGCLLIAAIASGQQAFDPSEVLAQARDKTIGLTGRIPRYTCMQTMNRTYYRSIGTPIRDNPCDQYAGDKQRGRRRLEIEATDRLRLDVIVTHGQEIFSWAGANQFDSRWVAEFIGQGPVGTGSFGPFLINIFETEGVHFEYKATSELRRHTVFEYSYQVPESASNYYTRRVDHQWLTTGFSGSLFVNPATGELERLTVHTGELPPETGACTADTQVDYQNIRLGTGGFLLPLESELHFLLRDGRESNNVSSYSRCREYVAESKLVSEEPQTLEQSQQPAPSVTAGESTLPARLRITLALTAPIDTDVAAAGDSITAVVQAPVKSSKTGPILIPSGAVVRGRIVRMERRMTPATHFLISISWTRLETKPGGLPVSFFARIEQPDPQAMAQQAAYLNQRSALWLPPPGESNRASGWFIFPTNKPRHLVPAGYATKWMTVEPVH